MTETNSETKVDDQLSKITDNLIQALDLDNSKDILFGSKQQGVCSSLCVFSADESIRGAEWLQQNEDTLGNKFLVDKAKSDKMRADLEFQMARQTSPNKEEFDAAVKTTSLAYDQAISSGFNAQALYDAFNRKIQNQNRLV